MTDMSAWREFRPLIEWHSPLIGNTGMRDAPTTTASDAETDAEYERTLAALSAAKAHGERVGLKLGLDGQRMDAQERDAMWSEVQFAQQRIDWIGQYANRVLMERAHREAQREHAAKIERARARLAELDESAAAGPP